MKSIIAPKKERAEYDAEGIFLDLCRALIVILLLAVVGYAVFG